MEYLYRTITMPNDYEGKVIVTVIKAKDQIVSTKAVLYIHGYLDYFFQNHVAQYFVERGFHFYAVELRKYGHSYLKHQHFNYCRDMKEYYPDISKCIEEIIDDGNKEIILLGHSTGGLLASLYASEGYLKDKISKVILNSPFLKFNTSLFKRTIMIPLARLASKLYPYAKKRNEISPFYGESIYIGLRGEWDFDTSLKPLGDSPLYFAWLQAIAKAHRKIRKGLNIDVPVLVLSSDHSLHPKRWTDEIKRSDIVLNVKHIRKLSPDLGPCVTYISIKNGIHDLFLSEKKVRENALEAISEWLQKQDVCSELTSSE